MLIEIAAKQEAFEEANRLKNQFRALDDDEIEFLNEIRGRELAEEAKIRQETKEGLDAFRKHREAMEKKEREKIAQHDVVEEVKEDEWKVGRKRKAGKEKAGGLSIKLRKTSTTGSKHDAEETEKATHHETGTTNDAKDGCGSNAKSPSNSSTNGDAKAGGPASESKEMNDESICAGNIRKDATRDVDAAAKNGLALVSYDSDEDDEW